MTRAMLLDMLRDERECNGFLKGIDLEEYVDKLLTKSEFLVRSQGKRCLGVLAFYCNNWQAGKAFISLILVAQDARRRGIAHDLLDQAIRTARSRRFHSIGLEVEADNLSAKALYERFGFKAHGINHGLVSMDLEISPVKQSETFAASFLRQDVVLRVAK